MKADPSEKQNFSASTASCATTCYRSFCFDKKKSPTYYFNLLMTVSLLYLREKRKHATSQRPLIFVCAEQPKATEQCLKPPDLFLAVQCFEIWIANGFHANPRSSYASWWLVVWFESASMLSIFVCAVGGKLRLLGVHETHQRHIAGTGVVLWPPQAMLWLSVSPSFFLLPNIHASDSMMTLRKAVRFSFSPKMFKQVKTICLPSQSWHRLNEPPYS